MALCGATPVLADVDAETFNLDPASLERAVATAKKLGLKPRAVIPVDLFGLPADHDAIAAIAAAHDLFILDDAAQSFGATYKDRKLGAVLKAASPAPRPPRPASFRPSRSAAMATAAPIFTDDDDLAARIEACACMARASTNTMRRASASPRGSIRSRRRCLLEKLKIFPDEIAARNAAAQRYAAGLAGVAIVPRVGKDRPRSGRNTPSGLRAGRRDALAAALKEQGIPTAIYYAKPLHRQAAYSGFPVADGGLPVSERLADEVISLPMHAYLDVPPRIGSSLRSRGRWRLRAPLIPARKRGTQIEARVAACGTPGSPLSRGRAVNGNKATMIERILTVGGYTLLSRITGFLRDIMLAAFLGAGPVADAFFVAFRLPNHFRAIFAEGAFNAAFIPGLCAHSHPGGKDAAEHVRRPHFHPSARDADRAAGAGAPVHAAGHRSVGARLLARAAAISVGDFAHPHHLSLSPAHHAGDALGRHPQRAASLRRGGGGADPA